MSGLIILFPTERIVRLHLKEHEYDEDCRCGVCIRVGLKRIAESLERAGVILSEVDQSLIDLIPQGKDDGQTEV